MEGNGNKKMRKSNLSKSEQLKNLLRLLRYILKYYRLNMTVVVIFIFLSSLSMVRGTMYIKELIDEYILPYINSGNPDYSSLLKMLGLMASAYAAGIISTYIYIRIMTVTAQGTLKKLRDDVFSHMEQLPIKYFDVNAHGDIMSIYSSDIDTLKNVITEGITQLISAVVTVLSMIISMFILSTLLTILVIVILIFIIIVTRIISSKSSKNFIEQQKNIGEINGYTEEILEGLKVVKVFSHEKEVKEKFDILNEKLCASSNNANKYANILGPFITNLGNINFIITASLGAVLAINGIGGLTLGGIASFLQFIRKINQPVFQLTQQLNIFLLAGAGAKRVFDLLNQKVEFDEGFVTLVNAEISESGKITETDRYTGKWAWKYPHNDSVIYKQLTGDIVFENVDFGYSDENIILHDISLFARPGQKIAFVGATGAGKTTIANLINRFYDIKKGEIRYDGIDIKKIRKSDLRLSVGMVLQDTNLFSETIENNIRYGKLDASEEEIRKATKLANADYFINHLPNGYSTVLTGDSLSQGQKQLLSIARAAVANPPVLILDEATSSIDTRTEKIIQEGMDRLMTGRTVFVIAHRLSTIKNADVIMVLDHGKIIERGNHDELIAQKGAYYRLYTGGFENQ